MKGESRVIEGRVHRLGDHVNTDLIIPATYLVTSDPAKLGQHLLEGVDPGFPERVKPGDIIVAGDNFGSGSSREHAALALKGAGVSCVIARSFARIFFRNCINTGLPVVECADACDAIGDGDRIRVDLDSGKIEKLSTGETFYVPPYPDFLRGIIDSGGLVEFIRRRSALRGAKQDATEAGDTNCTE